MDWIASVVVTAVLFGVLDGLWLGRVGRPLYDRRLGHLMARQFDMPAALAFYAIYVLGITWFATMPALESGSALEAALDGAALGFVAYATWNLTNLAVLQDYPRSLVPIDMAWGTAATCLTATVTYLVVDALPFVP